MRTRATSGGAGRARDREQPAEEERQLTVRKPEHRVGDATLHRRAEQAVTRGDGLDAISGAAPSHDSVRDMPSRKRHRCALPAPSACTTRSATTAGAEFANTEPPATR